MTDTSPDDAGLARDVARLFDGTVVAHRPPAWRAWTADALVLLFESEHEPLARLLVILLASRVGSRPIVLESPEGAEQRYHDGRWQAIPERQSGRPAPNATSAPAPTRLRLVISGSRLHDC